MRGASKALKISSSGSNAAIYWLILRQACMDDPREVKMIKAISECTNKIELKP